MIGSAAAVQVERIWVGRVLTRIALIVGVAVSVPNCGPDRSVGHDRPVDRRDARRDKLEQNLREGGPSEITASALEYREIMDDTPAALRTIAEAYERVGNKQAAFEILRTLITRGHGTTTDKLRVLHLASETAHVDDALYRTGLKWLDQALIQEPWCATFSQLVTWTAGHAEHATALDRALAGCPRDRERATWFASRNEACNAAAHGDFGSARACIESHDVAWKVAVAKAILDKDALTNLRTAAKSPQITVFALLRLASTPGTPRDEACSALARAREKELAWTPVAGHSSAVEGRYTALRNAAGC